MKEKIERVISKLNNQWLDIEGVEGIGQSKIDNKDYIVVFINQETKEIENNIPKSFEGIPIRLFNSGKIIAEED
ncbi:hypothetical protein [Sporohalobacter salinus]|uniref:hypothetical protein n=1 Tax=Sporohalobacter salinus TaxID=1494606 RepID=UPI00195F9ACF|nr:hypothetical protein [Sporohalobacter salinus]MBM7622521.1 hypothetical protein [Sporohalobacter salinus]